MSTIQKFMTRDLITTTPDENIYTAVEELINRRVSGLLVVENDSSNKLVGILSEKDCFKIFTEYSKTGNHTTDKVGSFMSKNPVGISQDASVFDAISEFLLRNFRRLPVVDDQGCLVGLITRKDVLKVAYKECRDDKPSCAQFRTLNDKINFEYHLSTVISG